MRRPVIVLSRRSSTGGNCVGSGIGSTASPCATTVAMTCPGYASPSGPVLKSAVFSLAALLRTVDPSSSKRLPGAITSVSVGITRFCRLPSSAMTLNVSPSERQLVVDVRAHVADAPELELPRLHGDLRLVEAVDRAFGRTRGSGSIIEAVDRLQVLEHHDALGDALQGRERARMSPTISAPAMPPRAAC